MELEIVTLLSCALIPGAISRLSVTYVMPSGKSDDSCHFLMGWADCFAFFEVQARERDFIQYTGTNLAYQTV